MIKKLHKKKNLIFIIISAVTIGISFTFDKLSLLMWIGFIPFLYVFINEVDSYKKGFKRGLIFGTTYYLIILQWIFSLYPLTWVDINNRDSIILLLLGWIIISLIEGSVFGVVLGFFSFIKTKNNILNVLYISLLWVIIEWIQGLGMLGFPWGKLAVSQTEVLPIIQSSSLFGSLFIGFLIILVNGLFMLGVREIYLNRKVTNKYIVLAIIIFLSNIGFGVIKLNLNYKNEFVDISVIQGNISSEEKWSLIEAQDHYKIYESLTKEAIKSSEGKTKIVFWPESAVPLNITYAKWLSEKYLNLAKENNIHFLTGVFHTEKEPTEKEYNSVYSINEDGEVKDKYFKRHLVPFGEILPFKDTLFKLIPDLKDLNMFDGYLVGGEEAVVTDTTSGKIGTVICFESIFPSLVLDNVRDDAELIFIATNDSWFKNSKAVYQHNDNAILRAVESNRYVVRAANTGISSVINNKGEIINSLPTLERGYINTKVQFINENSIYSRIGDIIVVFAFVIILIAALTNKKNNDLVI